MTYYESIRRRAAAFIVEDRIPVPAVAAATDEECYRCGRTLTWGEGKVIAEPVERIYVHGLFSLCCDICASGNYPTAVSRRRDVAPVVVPGEAASEEQG